MRKKTTDTTSQHPHLKNAQRASEHRNKCLVSTHTDRTTGEQNYTTTLLPPTHPPLATTTHYYGPHTTANTGPQREIHDDPRILTTSACKGVYSSSDGAENNSQCAPIYSRVYEVGYYVLAFASVRDTTGKM